MIGTVIMLAAALTGPAAPPAIVLHETIHLYDPVRGAYLGAEQTWFAHDGRRLRWRIDDANGDPTLLFFVLHDEQGHEQEAIYFEGDARRPSRERFTYSPDRRLRTTSYYDADGAKADRTEVELDAAGREIRKRFYRADGSHYGNEDVFWNAAGDKAGWDFRYVERQGGASFRYVYESFDADGRWTHRLRRRDGEPERIEVRSVAVASARAFRASPARFASGRISTDRSETSPSFTRDGKTMVFARYGDDWNRKEPFIAHLEESGWRVEPLGGLGFVYNLAIVPDGSAIYAAVRSGERPEVLRLTRRGAAWSPAENLTERYGLRGTYPCVADDGTLFLHDADGPSGAGIYAAPPRGDGFGAATPVYVPVVAPGFDAYTADGASLLVTRCFDDICESGAENGIWEARPSGEGPGQARKLTGLPYAWGAQPVEALGLFVFTDGEDILAIPLSAAGLGQDH